MKNTKKVKKSKHNRLPMSIEEKALLVPCPRCGVFPGKSCVHTKGSGKGKKCTAHEDRIKLSKVKLSAETKSKIQDVENVFETKAKPKPNAREKLTAEQKQIVETITDKITVLGRHAEFVGPVSVGPIISTYRFFPLRRTKVAHLEAMSKDFAVALGAETIVVKRMPGESAVGVFVPNKVRKMVMFKDTLTNVSAFTQEEQRDKHLPIPLNFGIDSVGNPFVDDLTMQPHLLIAGTTGGGKSTLEHALALGIIWTMSPEECKLIISDTKGVEFKAFKDIPHLQFPICTDVYMTMQALQWCVDETQKRLDKIGQANVRNIHEFNLIDPKHQIPYVVVIIDELNDLLGPALEKPEAAANAAKLSTIVARSRASGIHMIAATQRPDVRLIKGSIKANFSSRLAFRLPSHQDSRTVLSTKGAENLMSRGDMFYQSSTSSDLKRLHAPYTALDDTKMLVGAVIARHQKAHDDAVKSAEPILEDEHIWKPTVN